MFMMRKNPKEQGACLYLHKHHHSYYIQIWGGGNQEPSFNYSTLIVLELLMPFFPMKLDNELFLLLFYNPMHSKHGVIEI